MKVVTLYECGVCGMKYNAEQSALICEASHKLPTGARRHDHEYVRDVYGYPYLCDVVFDDITLVYEITKASVRQLESINKEEA